jgi:hypothetical protein
MPMTNRRKFVLTSLTVLALPRRDSTAEQPVLRFGLVTDAHYADYESLGNRHYRESLAKMSECVESMNQQGAQFLVDLGDFNDGARKPAEDDALRYLSEIEARFARFSGPRYHVLGNHNMDALSKTQVLSQIKNTGVDPERSYFSFDRGGRRFLVLDACFRSDGAPYDRGDFHWTDANIPAAELQWIQKQLEDSPHPVIVFIHQLLDGSGNVFVKNAAEVRRVLEDSGKVLAVFQGHHHCGSYRELEGIHYYTLRAMVEGSGPENSSYALVDVQPDRIVVQGYRRAVDQTISSQ